MESRLRSTSYGSVNYGESRKASSYEEIRETTASSYTSGKSMQNGKIEELKKKLEDLKRQLQAAEQEQILKQQINEVQEQINAIKNQDFNQTKSKGM